MTNLRLGCIMNSWLGGTMHVAVKRFLDRENNVHEVNFEEFPNEGAFYRGDTLFVDNTAIARFVNGVQNQRVLLISADGLSPKITPYLPELESASKVNPKNIFKIPQARATSKLSHTFDIYGIHSIIEARLDHISKQIEEKERTVYLCNQYMKLYTLYESLRTRVLRPLPYELEWEAEYGACEEHLEEINTKVSQFIKEHSYKELVDIAFFRGDLPEINIDENFRSLLRSALNSSGDLSFLKVLEDGNTYSPDLDKDGKYRFVMSNEDSINLTEEMLAGTLKHGMKFGNFTIMSKSHGYIKISCNKYTPEMLKIVHDDCVNFKNSGNN